MKNIRERDELKDDSAEFLVSPNKDSSTGVVRVDSAVPA